MYNDNMKKESLFASGYECPEAAIITLTAAEGILSGSWDKGEVDDDYTDLYIL